VGRGSSCKTYGFPAPAEFISSDVNVISVCMWQCEWHVVRCKTLNVTCSKADIRQLCVLHRNLIYHNPHGICLYVKVYLIM